MLYVKIYQIVMEGEVLCIFTLILTTNSYFINLQCPQMCICHESLTDCKNSNFSDLPEEIDPNVKVLDLSYNIFEVFPKNLNAYPYIKYLNLSHNKIQSLGSNNFRNLKNLERLDLTYNKFHTKTDLPANAFFGADNLTFLDLSYNSLGNLTKDSFLQINSLKILRLNNCSITYFSKRILDKLPNLEELHLSGNPIKYLTAEFESKKLKFLDLSKCELEFISSTVFKKLTGLQTLYIYKNSKLKQFLCDSSSLIYLDLSDCNLEEIPKGHLPKLNKANFHGNHLRVIPDFSLVNYSSLELLDLSYNAISNIGEKAFTGLETIIKIDLSENTLTLLNRDLFEYNENLKSLNLSRNYFSTVQNLISDSLENLDLSYCEIKSVDFDSLVDMPMLKFLSLSKNVISVLPDNWKADNLQNLDISYCHIKNINNKTFVNMPSLRQLNLAGNRLTTASPESFSQVIFLDLSDNTWRCDCQSLKPLYNWLSKSGKRLDGLYCESPEIFAGMSWLSACQKEWHPELSRSDSVLWYTTGLIVTVFGVLFVILAMRRMYLLKEKRIRERDAARRAEEREALRRMQRMQAEVQEETNRNAPDPRELQTPPSYNEALLLPKLDSSHPSLSGSLHSLASKHSINGSLPDVSKRTRPKRKRRRRKSDSSEGQRASRVVVDSDTSDAGLPQPRTMLESDI